MAAWLGREKGVPNGKAILDPTNQTEGVDRSTADGTEAKPLPLFVSILMGRDGRTNMTQSNTAMAQSKTAMTQYKAVESKKPAHPSSWRCWSSCVT